MVILVAGVLYLEMDGNGETNALRPARQKKLPHHISDNMYLTSNPTTCPKKVRRSGHLTHVGVPKTCWQIQMLGLKLKFKENALLVPVSLVPLRVSLAFQQGGTSRCRTPLPVDQGEGQGTIPPTQMPTSKYGRQKVSKIM